MPCGGYAATSARRKNRRRRNDTEDRPHDCTDVAASYSRYSSSQQCEDSITDQQRLCRELAGSNGHRLLPEFEYADEAISGTKLRRAGLDAMLGDAQVASVTTCEAALQFARLR
jgi:site-specific DNA recombinase